MVTLPRKMVADVDLDCLLIIAVILLVRKLLRYFPEIFLNLFLQVAFYITVHKKTTLVWTSQNFHLRKSPAYILESSHFSKLSKLADENILL